jgi:hypothetical protein
VELDVLTQTSGPVHIIYVLGYIILYIDAVTRRKWHAG